MIKKILLTLVLLAVLGLAAIYFFGSSALNKGIKSGVETYGPRVTQTPVTLESVNLSILSGSGTLKQLKVGNPEGFQSENIFALGRIDIDVDTGSVFGDKIIIDKVHIRAPEMSYEKSMRSSNVKELLANIEEFTGPADPADPAPGEDAGAKKQVVIRELIIEDAKVYVGVMGVGQTVTIPRIEMKDIGEDGNRVTMAQAVDLILTKVLANIGPAIANAGQLLREGGQKALDAAREEGLKRVDEAAKDAADKASEGIKNLLGN